MNIMWHLRGDTKTCEFMFRLTEAVFTATMTLEQFIAMVDQMFPMAQQLKALMSKGLDPQQAIAECEKLIAQGGAKPPQPGTKERCLRNSAGAVIGQLDADYEIVRGQVVFGEILLTATWTDGNVWLNGVHLMVESVESQSALLVDEKGTRGPVMKGVKCKVVK